MFMGLQLHGGSVEAFCRNLLANCLVSEERIAPLGACSVGFAGLGGSQAQKTGALNAVIVIVISFWYAKCPSVAIRHSGSMC